MIEIATGWIVFMALVTLGAALSAMACWSAYRKQEKWCDDKVESLSASIRNLRDERSWYDSELRKVKERQEKSAKPFELLREMAFACQECYDLGGNGCHCPKCGVKGMPDYESAVSKWDAYRLPLTQLTMGGQRAGKTSGLLNWLCEDEL